MFQLSGKFLEKCLNQSGVHYSRKHGSGKKKNWFAMLLTIPPEQRIVKRRLMLTKKNKRSQMKTKYFHTVKPQSRENIQGSGQSCWPTIPADSGNKMCSPALSILRAELMPPQNNLPGHREHILSALHLPT